MNFLQTVKYLLFLTTSIKYTLLQTLEKIDAQYDAELARKAQVASEVQSVVESENIPADNVPSQQSGESNAAENNESKDQSSNVITNQETIAAPVNALSVFVPKPKETAADSECKESMLKSTQLNIYYIYINAF